MNSSDSPVTRRQFIFRTSSGAILLSGLGGTARSADRMIYDVERFKKTDPKVIGYTEFARFSGPKLRPRCIAVGPQDRIYIAASEGVKVFDPTGAETASFPTTTAARCLAVSPEGMIYVGLRDHIEVFDPKGQPKAAWESPGAKTWLTGLGLNDKDVFAADSANRVVLRYDKSGKLQGRIGLKDKDRNVPGLVVPSPYLDVKVGKDGLLRVNNPGRHRVEVYTPEGDLEQFWGRPTAAIEGFCGCCNPIALAMMPDGRQVTCEKGLPRVKVYSAEGAFQSVVAGTELFPENGRAGSTRDPSDGTMGGLDVAVDSKSQVWVLDFMTAKVVGFRSKGGAGA